MLDQFDTGTQADTVLQTALDIVPIGLEVLTGQGGRIGNGVTDERLRKTVDTGEAQVEAQLLYGFNRKAVLVLDGLEQVVEVYLAVGLELGRKGGGPAALPPDLRDL